MKDDEALDPVHVGVFGAAAAVPYPQSGPELVEQPGWRCRLCHPYADGAGVRAAASLVRSIGSWTDSIHRRRYTRAVPVVSVFFGIVIRMFYQEHEPPHFHAEHQGERATFDFAGKLLAGQLKSRTARRLICQWAALHQRELEKNWSRIKSGEPLERIAPLD